MLPTPALARRIHSLARDTGATLAVLDPALPAGLVGRWLDPDVLPYSVILHGSELAGRLPLGAQLMGRVVAGARSIIAAGNFPASDARRVAGARTPRVDIIPPGIDATRFQPLGTEARRAARLSFGLDEDAPLVVGVSRLVPRKGFHTLVNAMAGIATRRPGVQGAIGGTGRELTRLQRLVERTGAPVTLLGRVSDDNLPLLYACADVFCMPCSTRWAGLEPEGFGIVFVEAAACGVPQVAGDSGGAADAVVDGETGIILRTPDDPGAVAAAIEQMLADGDLRARLGNAARQRAVTEFDYDALANRLRDAIASVAP
jgi:phosphatidylinositol alpha-1,6-mannosyltransferase